MTLKAPRMLGVTKALRLMNLTHRATFKRRFRFWAGFWLLLLLFYFITNMAGLIRWRIPTLPQNIYPESSAFLLVRNSDTYIYSALANMAPVGAPDSAVSAMGRDSEIIHPKSKPRDDRSDQAFQFITQELGQDLELVITGLDRSRSWASSFACCVKLGGSELDTDASVFATTAASYFEYVKPFSWSMYMKEYWLYGTQSLYVASQYSCKVPRHLLSKNSMPTFATLAPLPSLPARILSPFLFLSWPWWLSGYQDFCPRDATEYVMVEYPERSPGSLGLCSKVNHNSPDPDQILEWFEVQRIVGVDRIVVYDMGDNSPDLNRVLEYYESTGLLERQAYDLPGEPQDRSLDETFKRTAQFNQDETLAVMECRLRLSGHGLVLSLDKDEVLVPRQNVTLKHLLQGLFSQHSTAASFIFPTQFFLTTWPQTNPEEEMLVLSYRRTRVARWECWKYVFLPARVKAAVTHEVFPIRGFSVNERVSETVAILHHYRECPKDTWGTCDVRSTVDNTMARYKHALTMGKQKVKVILDTQRQKQEESLDENGSVRED